MSRPREPVSYSSTSLRERDQAMREGYEQRIQVITRTADDLRKQLFSLQNAATDLAKACGFEDAYQAQIQIQASSLQLNLRQCYEEIPNLRRELADATQRLVSLEAELKESEEAKERAHARLSKLEAERPAHARAQAELKELQKQYDELLINRNRAAERYKVDYRKWSRYVKWSTTEEARLKDETAGLLGAERDGKSLELLARRQEKIVELGMERFLDPEDPDEGDATSTPSKRPASPSQIKREQDENTPISGSKRRRVSSASVTPSKPPPSKDQRRRVSSPLKPSQLRAVTNILPPSNSPTVFNQAHFAPRSTGNAAASSSPFRNQPIESTPSKPVHGPLRRVGALQSQPNLSSDTEEDSSSQAFDMVAGDGKTVFKVPFPPSARKTPAPSALPSSSTPCAETTPKVANSATTTMETPSKGPTPPTFQNNCVKEEEEEDELPLYAIPVPRPPSSMLFSTTPKDTARTPKTSSNQQRTSFAPPNPITPRVGSTSAGHQSTGRTTATVHVTVDRCSDTTHASTSTPAAPPEDTRACVDYSAFKGRGRYGKSATKDTESDTTINAKYTINPVNNDGMGYQYEEVVRNKDARRKLHAADCECCRDYYQNIGPLPPRLQAPLWRSPPNTPVKSNMASSSRPATDPDAHRKAISRHRHNWARAKTPPGYWDIGFPDTQEANAINEKAKEMERQKMRDIEREAESENGRYKRRT